MATPRSLKQDASFQYFKLNFKVVLAVSSSFELISCLSFKLIPAIYSSHFVYRIMEEMRHLPISCHIRVKQE